MSQKSLIERIDDFEMELACIKALVDIVYNAPLCHPYHSKYLEDLHTHCLNIQIQYSDMRCILLKELTCRL